MNKSILREKKVALIVGSGALPAVVIAGINRLGIDFAIIKFKGIETTPFNEEKVIDARFEHIDILFDQLAAKKFNSVICCGYMRPPNLNLNEIEKASREILKPIVEKFQIGDEAVFSEILKLFQLKKLEPLSIKDIVPELFPKFEYLTTCRPKHNDILDTERCKRIFEIISPADLGQSLVVRHGACLAVETSLGTDKMLATLNLNQNRPFNDIEGGLLYKAPKIEQNPFLDFPVIGERTVLGVKKARLNGIVIKHSSVIVLRPSETIELANRLGIFIWSKK
tara:strand:+ start:106 stop:948 length:843 start_codon:yes stop_codon:yes gene_type:complete